MYYSKNNNRKQKQKTKKVSNFDKDSANDNNKTNKEKNNKECNKLNVQKVNIDIDKDKDKDVYSEITKDFDQYSDIDDLKQYDIDFLTQLYNNIIYSLNSFHNNNNAADIMNYNRIMKLHFTCNNIIFVIESKKYEDNNIKSELMQKKIEDNISLNKKIKKEMIKTKLGLKKIERQVSSVLATIISFVLSISIISSAIIGIEHINSNYILPYVSTLIFFGMIMILFIFSIYKNKIKFRSWFFIVITCIVSILLWVYSINSVVNISNQNLKNEDDNVEIVFYND